jgi:uncharacterized membrane protein required for colicin V production
MTSSFLDITYIAITCLSLAAGLYSGAVKLIIGFIFFILSFLFSYLIFVPITDIMHEYITNNFILNIVSLAASYLICAIFCAIIAKKLKVLVEDISGGMTDRFIGLALGLARGALVSLILFTSVMIFTSKSYDNAHNILDLVRNKSPETSPHWVSSSKFNPDLKMFLDKTIDLIGTDTLKKILLPKHETPPVIEKKDPFDAMIPKTEIKSNPGIDPGPR